MIRCYKVLTAQSLPVVLCTFIRACCHVGIIKTMGIYLEDITLSLGTTSTDIGVALGLLNAFSLFPAPLIAALYRCHSIRRLLLMFGACLPATGVALTAMATSNAQMTVYLSITGFGNCVLMLCCTMTLHRVAAENYNLLYSLGLTGFGVGMVLLPILAEVLHKSYGWRGGLLIIGAVMANIIPCAVAIKSGSQNGFQSVPSTPPGCTVEKDCNGTIRQDTKGDDSDQCGVLRRITNRLRQSEFYLDPVFNVILAVTFVFNVVYCGWHSFPVPRNVVFAVNEFFAGLGVFFGGYLSGMIADRFSSYDATFKLLAITDVLVLLLIMVVRCKPKPSST